MIKHGVLSIWQESKIKTVKLIYLEARRLRRIGSVTTENFVSETKPVRH